MIRWLINLLNALAQRRQPQPYVGRTNTGDAVWHEFVGRYGDDLGDLTRLTLPALWAAAHHGECCTCGHDWLPGEMIGQVTQAYVRRDDGSVARLPGTRLACCVCVEQQRVQGDPSVQWARKAGLLR